MLSTSEYAQQIRAIKIRELNALVDEKLNEIDALYNASYLKNEAEIALKFRKVLELNKKLDILISK